MSVRSRTRDLGRKSKRLANQGARRIRRRHDEPQDGTDVPGPSPNPATNLLFADIAVRGASMIFRRSLQKGLLRARFSPDEAHRIIKGRTLGSTLFSVMIARTATRSVPGAVLVGGGLLAKTIYDRSISKRRAMKEGEEDLKEQAKDA